MTPVRSPDQVSRQWGRHVARWMAAGVPYLCGGADPEKGLDCWGLMVALYREAWIELPEERAAAFSDCFERTRNPSRLGDLYVFEVAAQGEAVQHVAIDLGDGTAVHMAPAGLCRVPTRRLTIVHRPTRYRYVGKGCDAFRA